MRARKPWWKGRNTMNDMNQKYDHLEVEKGKYAFWLANHFFEAGNMNKPPFCIVIPPPNVTGKLHLGHTFENTLQDIIIRRKRMQGYDALYLPGMDHAGIATQAKVDQKLKMEGISRFDIGREEYLKVAWKWKEEYAGYIRKQWESMGLSLDYSRERFTIDKGLSEAVEKVFVTLYEQGYIYRGVRIINWDVEAKTALSDIEIEHKEIQGNLYYYTYKFSDSDGGLTVATTRPETMFADTALMVHPEDERFRQYIGREVYIPLTNTKIKVISDMLVDREFGTGIVKVTPAHDPNDFLVGQRHNLPMPLCMNEDGSMNSLAGPYEGMDRFQCRKEVVKELEKQGLMQKIEPIIHNVGHSERTGIIIEPRLSKQWFVAMKDLADKALENSEVAFVPERFQKIFEHWMEDIQDWCISRQLWWGHRIPVWYKDDEIYCGHESPGEGWRQDEDVLDTWFSSALWPFSTLGWPHETADFKRYYPNSVMVTGYDIIFFWVARMIFQGIHFTKQSPFKECVIHGLVRDSEGKKMSKSSNNGVDPQDVVREYGADSLRYFISTNSAPGFDLRYETEKVESSWNFINKLWNISRYVIMTTDGMKKEDIVVKSDSLGFAEKWILERLAETIKEADRQFDRFDFGEAAKAIYNFTWNDFAAWYLEMSKLNQDSATTKSVLLYVLDAIIKLLHPFMPFVTEDIYQRIPHDILSITIAKWPTAEYSYPETSGKEYFFELIRKVRQIRNEYNVPYTKKIAINIECDPEVRTFTQENSQYIERFLNPEKIVFTQKAENHKRAIMISMPELIAFIPLGSLVDIDAEISRLNKETDRLQKEIDRSNAMLTNESFLAKAPEAKIAQEKEKHENYRKQLAETKARLQELTE
mgnify:FL=1